MENIVLGQKKRWSNLDLNMLWDLEINTFIFGFNPNPICTTHRDNCNVLITQIGVSSMKPPLESNSTNATIFFFFFLFYFFFLSPLSASVQKYKLLTEQMDIKHPRVHFKILICEFQCQILIMQLWLFHTAVTLSLVGNNKHLSTYRRRKWMLRG